MEIKRLDGSSTKDTVKADGSYYWGIPNKRAMLVKGEEINHSGALFLGEQHLLYCT